MKLLLGVGALALTTGSLVGLRSMIDCGGSCPFSSSSAPAVASACADEASPSGGPCCETPSLAKARALACAGDASAACEEACPESSVCPALAAGDLAQETTASPSLASVIALMP